MDDSAPTAEELLAHSEWLTRLARALVGDAAAGDVVQDTYEAALAKPAKPRGPVRPWLGGVARNMARMAARGRMRRERREQAVPVHDDVPSPEELLARAQIQQKVGRLVIELPEPLRSTLLLRFFEGMTAAEIARAQGVPAATVRSRVKDALDRIREALDAEHAGDRRAWAVLLAPLPTALPNGGAVIAGGLLVKTSVKVLIAIVIAAVLVVGTRVAGLWGSKQDTPPVTAKPTEPATPQGKPATPQPSSTAARELPMIHDDDPKGSLRLEGQVLGEGDKPAAGVTVVLGSNPPRTAVSEEDGGFAFDDLVGRPYTLVARGPGGIAGPVTAKLTATSEPVVLRLRPAAKVVVRVATADGKPVDGATVELRGIDDQRETTKQGVATFSAAVPGGYQLAAWAEGYAHVFSWLQVGSGETTAELVLVPGARVAGTVVDEAGAPVAGARVVYSGASDWMQQGDDRRDAVVSGSDGGFAFAAMPAGSFRFLASHDALAPGTSTLVTLDGKTERTGVTITMAKGSTVSGRVLDGSGKPVAGARVRLGSAQRTMIAAPPRQAYSDDQGAFEISGMPRRELVAVAIHETAASQSVPVDATKGDVSGVTLALDVTGTIAGIVVDPTGQPVEGVQVSAGPSFSDSRAAPDMVNWRLRGFPRELTDAGGRFTLTGLAPGSYLVAARPAHSASRGRQTFGEGTPAQTGQRDLKIVLEPEGAVTGKVAFADGTAPPAYTVSVNFQQQSFATEEFTLDALAPVKKAELSVRGPTFQARTLEIAIDPGKTTDVGTITVAKGRGLGGIVLADGRPVAGATVYAGRMIFGTGSSSAAQMMSPMGRGTKTVTTGEDGTFTLTGFGDGDLTIVAEHPSIGRSKALRLPTEMPGQTELTLELQVFGALSGILRQGGKPAEGVFVSAQSTTSPGALYNVASGPDGAYRFDKLAPDTYKVSATLGMPMMGMKFYSKQVTVPSGKEVTIDLAVEPGAVTLTVTPKPKAGELGVASVWLTSGAIAVKTAAELSLRMAQAGAGSSQWIILRQGEPAVFKDVVPGAYSVCVAPFPAEVKGMAAMGYSERHGDKLPAYCRSLTVGSAPSMQNAEVAIELPPFIPDAPPPGSGSGSGK
jgi:RNA polymerase sigma-70 factor (ECF subfamily)